MIKKEELKDLGIKVDKRMMEILQELRTAQKNHLENWDPDIYTTDSSDAFAAFPINIADLRPATSTSDVIIVDHMSLLECQTKDIEERMFKVMSEDSTDPRLMFEHTDVYKVEGISKRDDRPVFTIIDKEKFDKIKPELEKLGSIEFVDDYEMMDAEDVGYASCGIGDT